MAADHILALDAGSSGARCLIVRPDTGTVAVTRQEWSYDTPPEIGPLGKSFDPEAFWSILCDVTRRALASAGLSGADIAAVGVTSQRLGLVIIDEDGSPLYAGPNADVRAPAQGFAIDAKMAERVYTTTGKLPSLLLAPAKLQWLQQHDEAGFERATVLTMGDWVAYRLTGERRAEQSLAGGCGLLDITTRKPHMGLLDELGLPARLLPPSVTAQEVVGKVRPDAAEATGLASGTPVIIAGADTQVALVGMGIETPGEVGIDTGWSCPVMQVTAEPRIDPELRTWAGVHALPDLWVLESSAGNGGRVWRWWSEMLLGEGGNAMADAATLAEQAPLGAGEITALLESGPMNAGAMGLHLGGILMTTPLSVGAIDRSHLLRAVLENIAYALRANLEQAEEVSGLRAVRVALGGGLVRVPIFPRILADVLGRPIEAALDADVTGRGAAILAARAIAKTPPVALKPMERIEPQPDATAAYQRYYERWRQLSQRLDTLREELP